MHDQCVEVVCQEKDLGRCINSVNRLTSYNKASRILGLINRTIKYKHKDILLRLYKSLVRLHLEYCIVTSVTMQYSSKKDKIKDFN